MIKKILLCYILVFYCVVSVYSKDEINIAVAEFEGQHVSAMDARLVSDLLRTEIVKTATYNIVDRDNMEEILAEQEFQMTGCTDQNCAVQMGKLLNVNKIIIGSVMKLGSIYIINTSIIDIETGRIEKSEKVKAESMEELPTQAEYLAGILTGDMAIKKKTKDKIAIGLNYPGFSLKFFFSEKFCIESKYQVGENIHVFGIRPSLYLNSNPVYLFFIGVEVDFVTYKSDVSEGYGMVGEPYIGMEFFSIKNLSVQFDIGPAFVALQDKDQNNAANGFDICGNIGVNYYFR